MIQRTAVPLGYTYPRLTLVPLLYRATATGITHGTPPQYQQHEGLASSRCLCAVSFHRQQYTSTHQTFVYFGAQARVGSDCARAFHHSYVRCGCVCPPPVMCPSCLLAMSHVCHVGHVGGCPHQKVHAVHFALYPTPLYCSTWQSLAPNTPLLHYCTQHIISIAHTRSSAVAVAVTSAVRVLYRLSRARHVMCRFDFCSYLPTPLPPFCQLSSLVHLLYFDCC